MIGSPGFFNGFSTDISKSYVLQFGPFLSILVFSLIPGLAGSQGHVYLGNFRGHEAPSAAWLIYVNESLVEKKSLFCCDNWLNTNFWYVAG